uniref:NB-ARC domain-containing protein n=1 Tax=Salix viminalis TaxID=40686 RepID=A0A6N2KKM3_SALVM
MAAIKRAFKALIGRSLIAINTLNRLRMHDIVRRWKGNYSSKQIVLPKDTYTVLSKEMGTEAVEGLALDVQGSFSTKSFKKMRRLQLLQITGAHLAGSYSLLPRELIWLCWLECPFKSFPFDFHLSELVILDMQKSNVRKLWKGTKDCKSLKTFPESMGSLKSLQTLNVTECSQLEKLPDSLGGLESLTELLAKGTAIKQLPTFGGNNYSPKSFSSSIYAMRPASFTNLDLSGNGFFNLPSSIRRLPKHKDFTVERCKNLLSISELPSSVLVLSINGCRSIERVSAPHQVYSSCPSCYI